MIKKYTNLRFTEINKKTKEARPLWVQSISWGDGLKVKRVSFTRDRAQAAGLSSSMALAVAEQYFTHPIVLEFSDGTPNVELTAQLLKSQMAKLTTHNEIVRKANTEMRAFWNELVVAVPGLAEVVRLK